MYFSNVNIYSLIVFIIMLFIIGLLSRLKFSYNLKVNDIIEINKRRLTQDENKKVTGYELEKGAGGYKFLIFILSIIIFILCIMALLFGANIVLDLIGFSGRPDFLQYFVIKK